MTAINATAARPARIISMNVWQTLRSGVAALAAAGLAAAACAGPNFDELRQAYAQRVQMRLDVPVPETARYAKLVQSALDAAGIAPDRPQYVVAIDRSPWVQAVFVLWRGAGGQWSWVGASPASTGRPGSVGNFETPLGVFEHSPAHMDFRSDGTADGDGLSGYGTKGQRVFDFGWQPVPRGWGDGTVTRMRLQMHATDPDALERRLGTAQSEGSVRIPAALDSLLDHYGVIDAAYEALERTGQGVPVLAPDREPVDDAGRWLVVIDSARDERPDWAPAPWLPHRRPPPK